MASVEYGFRNAIKITDGSAHIMLKTEEIMYYFTSLDEIEFEFSAKWITKKGRAKYILSIDTLILPSLLYINKAKVLVQSEHTSKNMMEEIGSLGETFGGLLLDIFQPTDFTSDTSFKVRINNEVHRCACPPRRWYPGQ